MSITVRIRESGVTETLSIIDPASGVDYIADFVCCTDALRDGQFTWDDSIDAYVCDQETFGWWATVIEDVQALNYRIHALVEEHGSRVVYDVIHTVDSSDLETHAETLNRVLDEHFGGAS